MKTPTPKTPTPKTPTPKTPTLGTQRQTLTPGTQRQTSPEDPHALQYDATAGIAVRRSDERGRANFGWLNSQHSFSFGSYYDPAHMGFGALRVINEDHVAAGGGFPAHGHANMEILSYVVSGGLAHEDSAGNADTIKPGDVQLMSAGSGIRHSEMNASQTQPVHFLQIWIMPREQNTTPRYEQEHFERTPGARLLASADARDGSIHVGQDVDLYRVILDDDSPTTPLPLTYGNAWVQVISGSLRVNANSGARAAAGDGTSDITLRAGDAVAVSKRDALSLFADEPVEALVFDLR